MLFSKRNCLATLRSRGVRDLWAQMACKLFPCLIGYRVRCDDTLLARQHVGACRAAREEVLGYRHEAAGVLQVHMLADADDAVLDLDQVIGVLAPLAPLAAP